MKIKYQIGIWFFLFYLFSCKNNLILTNYYPQEKKQYKYVFFPPSGYKKVKKKIMNDTYIIMYVYADSTIFYISKDNFNPYHINKENRIKKFKKDVDITSVFIDTIDISGKDSLGNYWRDRKEYSIYWGYKNVPAEKKEIFDRAMDSVQKISCKRYKKINGILYCK